MNQQKSPNRKNQEEKEKKNKRRISGASRPKPDLIILAYRERNFRERKRKKSRSASSLLTMQSLSASHRLSGDKKTQQASDLFFVSLFSCFVYLKWLTHHDSTKRTLLGRVASFDSGSNCDIFHPRSKNQVLNKLLSSKQWRKEKKK